MIIQYFGLNSFRIQSNGLSIITDPIDPKTGLKLPRMQNDVVIVSDKSNAKAFDNKIFTIDCPGEYEVKGCFIYGIAVNGGGNERTMYVIELEGLRLAYLGAIKQGVLTDDQLDKLEEVDVLMVPVGGGESLDSKQAIELISQIEPRVILPMNYQLAGLKIKLDSLDKFKKDSAYKSETTDKYKVVKKDLPHDDTIIVIIKPQA